jgi:hypothetical protein
MNTNIPLDEPVAPDKYPDCQDSGQQNRQTPQKIAFEASSYRHIFEQQPFDRLRTSPLLPVTSGYSSYHCLHPSGSHRYG